MVWYRSGIFAQTYGHGTVAVVRIDPLFQFIHYSHEYSRELILPKKNPSTLKIDCFDQFCLENTRNDQKVLSEKPEKTRKSVDFRSLSKSVAVFCQQTPFSIFCQKRTFLGQKRPFRSKRPFCGHVSDNRGTCQGPLHFLSGNGEQHCCTAGKPKT